MEHNQVSKSRGTKSCLSQIACVSEKVGLVRKMLFVRLWVRPQREALEKTRVQILDLPAPDCGTLGEPCISLNLSPTFNRKEQAPPPLGLVYVGSPGLCFLSSQRKTWV